MKTRKMLAMLLSLAMVIGLMTPAAMAESLVDCPGSCTHEAEVGTTHYDTLSEAISEASAGATVTLLKDVAISEVNDRPIAAKAVTIDGAGHTITYTGGRDSNDYSVGVLTVAGGTVKNLTIVGGEDGRALLAKNLVADLNVENCVLDGVYGFNTSGGSADYGIAFTDTTFDAWTSFDPVKSADFTDCTFNANFRPYSTVTLTDCILGADGVLDESKLQENNTITVSGTTTVNSAAALTSALKLASAGATIKLGTDVIVNDVDNRPIATKAVTVDGAGNTIEYSGNRDGNGGSVGVLTVAGGTVKNLTIKGGENGRALLAKNLVADLKVENCNFSGAYGFNTSGGSADYGIAFTNTAFDSWTSYDPVKSADFTDCTFNANFRPYSTVTLTDCTFGATGTLDESKLKEGNTITVSGGTYSADPSKYVANGEIVKKISDTEYAVVVKSGLTAGTYMADPTGATADNHYVTNNNDGTWTVVYRAPSSGGNSGGSSSGGGSSSSSNTTTSTEKNPDGSTTTTTTNKTTGAVTETTKNPDGTTGVTKTDADGNVTEVSANVPAAAAKAAEKADEPVTLPVEIEAADNSAEATEIKVNVPASGATVEIPVENVTPGTVVVIVNADGTETIVPVTTLTEDGVVVTLEEDATVKVVDNSKDFVDVADDYALADSIDFVSARGLFEGNTETTFNPHANTTIAQTMTVLARLSGEDFYGAGSTAKGAEWAAEKGLSDGTDVNKAVTREQMVVMMWKLAGMPESDQPLTASDVNDISADALTAMQWAVEMGILKGNLDGTINPQGNASRAHVAAFTERYVNALAH